MVVASWRKVGTGLMGGDGGRRAEVKEKRTTCNGVDDSGSSSRLGQPARHLRRRDRQASHVTSRLVGWNWTGPPRFDPSLHFTLGQHMPPTQALNTTTCCASRDHQISRGPPPVGTTRMRLLPSHLSRPAGVKECGGRARAIQHRASRP